MGFFSNIVPSIARIAGDVMTFGTNELAGNPIGNFAQQVTNPTDPNAAANALTQKNIDMEYDFAKNGISWRIADAAKNGISPLAALGASEPSATPVNQVFDNTPSLGRQLLMAGAGEMGQGLARSLLQTQTPQQKANAALDLAYKSKQNDLLDLQIRGAQLALVKSSQSPGIPLGYRTVMNADGTTSTVAAEGINTHNSTFGPLLWSIDNQLIPSIQNEVSSIDRGNAINMQGKTYYLKGE